MAFGSVLAFLSLSKLCSATHSSCYACAEGPPPSGMCWAWIFRISSAEYPSFSSVRASCASTSWGICTGIAGSSAAGCQVEGTGTGSRIGVAESWRFVEIQMSFHPMVVPRALKHSGRS